MKQCFGSHSDIQLAMYASDLSYLKLYAEGARGMSEQYGETKAKLLKEFKKDDNYPSGDIGWSMFLVDRISALEKGYECYCPCCREKLHVSPTSLRAAGYLGEGE